MNHNDTLQSLSFWGCESHLTILIMLYVREQSLFTRQDVLLFGARRFSRARAKKNSWGHTGTAGGALHPIARAGRDN